MHLQVKLLKSYQLVLIYANASICQNRLFPLTVKKNTNRPYSTIPPKMKIRVPSHTIPYAAQPGGTSPLTAGTNH